MLLVGITERGDAAVHFDEYAPEGVPLPSAGYTGVILITKDPRTLYEKLQKKYKLGIKYFVVSSGSGGAQCYKLHREDTY